MYKFEFPFNPPMEDIKLSGKSTNGTECAVFDTCCKDFSTEDKSRADKAVMEIYIQAARKNRGILK